MRDGDTLGTLDILAQAQKYDCDISSFAKLILISCLLHHRCRDVTFLSHVPWLGAMILSYPELIPAYKKFRAHAQERAMRRLKEGSPYKDLFHHLVCPFACHLFSRGTIDG